MSSRYPGPDDVEELDPPHGSPPHGVSAGDSDDGEVTVYEPAMEESDAPYHPSEDEDEDEDENDEDYEDVEDGEYEDDEDQEFHGG